ncbi:class I adenylate-forming enzyme family protein [Bacillus marinisedimentorum]|uniref:class I adenylate-forming enzyme family protein n=1 Tax=Bacillus marinisedimentorum TaxID=1821260 RepID=UPI0008722C5B|nr:class I adenylate-forming enzyme family protein [Bacillus marinisedimentorum]
MILANEKKIAEYTAKGWWTTETIYDVFRKQVETRPDVEAILDPLNRDSLCGTRPKRLTFRELNDEVERTAALLLKNGVKKDDVIVVQLPNVVEIVIAYLAILRIGAIASPFPVQYREHEYKQLIPFTEAKAVMTMTQIGNYQATQSFVDAFHELPTVQTIFTWGSDPVMSQEVISLDHAGITDRDEDNLKEYTASLNETANDIFTICWTSGTEGKPKGVPRSHNEWFISAYASVDVAEFTEEDILLNTFPMVNMAGIGGMFVPWLLAGSKLVMHHPFDLPVFLQQIVQEKATYTLAPPALLNMMLHNDAVLEKVDISSLRAIGSGSAPLSPWMVKGWKEKYNIDIINYFGSNEGATFISGPKDIPDPVRRAQYFPRFGVKGLDWSTRVAERIESKLVDIETGEEIKETNHPGELRIKGAGVLPGYWKREDINEKVFDEEGFFRTGDLFEIAGEEENPKYYRAVGRMKDIIIRGGQNISPEEVEALLVSHPKVAEVSIVGYPDGTMGEKACACVVMKDKEDPLSLEEMIDFFKENKVAAYKIPERIQIIDALPRNPVGKILKMKLREQLHEQDESLKA